MEVLSLFDGMSCGQIALTELSYKFKYYASEIDKFAIKQTQLNFPETIQLGDIEDWRKWNIDWASIDLIIGGSPCQGFSFAGKQLNFSDERSKLFFVFVDILNHCKKFNPNVKFLLENVIMKKEYQKIINDMLGLFPVRINSNLVSAQNRDRLYWSNISIKMVGLFNEIHTDIEQPKDKSILLRDILQDENEVDEKYYLGNKIIQSMKLWKSSSNPLKTVKNINEKSRCATARGIGEIHSDMQIIQIGNVKIGRTDEAKQIRKENIKKGFDSTPFTKKEIIGIDYEKMSTLMTGTSKDNILTNGIKLRRLTPLECAKLQTVPSWYKWDCSDSKAYRMLGNGWTVEVIKHIISQLPPY